ncbi:MULTISPECIES: GNAT family N-acetyltransferase [unclassified Enterococcus]|jgi:ribosomal protein S18 acetylase RimI-like enzyme|uniref:GNAT family N-acetyltransferase n=1 Tax=unclassified Enterococcus TaxID=2608891 RepID=UPI003D280385
MKIEQSSKADLLPFLEEIFRQQHERQFNNHSSEETNRILAFSAWENDQLAGGIIGKRQYDTLHISLLGVQEVYQKAGIGSKLIKAMEEQAMRENIKTITLTTKAYQAVDFYLKQGYKIFGELEDVPIIGTKKYYLVKRIIE